MFINESLLFIFHGNEYLTVEGNPVIPGRFYAFKEGSIIRGPRISPFTTPILPLVLLMKTLPLRLYFRAKKLNLNSKKATTGYTGFLSPKNRAS
jgi:hypothetical protein